MAKLKIAPVARRFDTWVNAMTGLGSVARDKLMSTLFERSARWSDEYLENLYHDDDIAATICNELPEQALRNGFRVSSDDVEDNEVSDAAVRYLRKFSFLSKCADAGGQARALGGAVVYMGIDDSNTEEKPVNVERIKTIRFMTVLNKREIEPNTWYLDPEEDNFGEVETYKLRKSQLQTTTGGQKLPAGADEIIIHESRMLRFPGAPTTRNRRRENNGWDDSVLRRLHDTLRRFDTAWGSVAYLMQDASQGIFKIKDLISMIAEGDTDTLKSRMETVEMGRSVARSLMVDADSEDFQRLPFSFAGVPEVLQAFMLRTAAAGRMPVTVLMGQSPAGLNATGESDMRMWYDRCRWYQEKVLSPETARALEYVMAADDFEGGEAPDNWSVKWNPLWQLTEKEQAELEKLVAEKDGIYIDKEVALPEEIALSRYTANGFSMETRLDLDARKEILEEEIKLRKDVAGQDPMERQQQLMGGANAPGDSGDDTGSQGSDTGGPGSQGTDDQEDT